MKVEDMSFSELIRNQLNSMAIFNTEDSEADNEDKLVRDFMRQRHDRNR